MDSGEPNHKPTAICLVRAEISGEAASRHALEVRRHTARMGYTHLYTVRPPVDDRDPVGYALGIAAGLSVDAMVVYDLETVGHTPSRVCEMLDLETVCPPATWTASTFGVADPAHAHPEHALTVASAQRIMQRHKTCQALECPRKASAYSFLVREGKIIPPVETPRERAAARGIPFRASPHSDASLPGGVTMETLLDILDGLAAYSPVGKN